MNFFRKCLSLIYDKRASQRYALLGFFYGQFQLQSTGKQCLVHPLDICEGGLGVLTDEVPSVGEILIYDNDPDLPRLEFEVKHIQTSQTKIAGRKDMTRCGLKCQSKTETLSTFAASLSLMIQE